MRYSLCVGLFLIGSIGVILGYAKDDSVVEDTKALETPPVDESEALSFLNKKMDKYDKLLNLFWKNIGDQQTWNAALTFKYKKTDEEKFVNVESDIDTYIDLNKLKAMFRVSSDLGHLKAYAGEEKSLLLSRDTQSFCLEDTPIKNLAQKMNAMKTDKKNWDEQLKQAKELLLSQLGIQNVKLEKNPQKFAEVSCDALRFSRGKDVNYTLYFSRESGYLHGITLDSNIHVHITVLSNAAGYPTKFTGKISRTDEGEGIFSIELEGTATWKEGKFIDASMLIKVNYMESFDIEMKIDVSLDDVTPLRENVFEPRFNKEDYQLKSFIDFRDSLFDHVWQNVQKK